MKQYDYIFIGAGCAGLSLLTRMMAGGLTAGKKILLIDKSAKQVNDRTWCFWEEGTGFFEPIVCKQWNRLWFRSPSFSKQFTIDPYRYKMIKGIDFYRYCFSEIARQPGIDILHGNVRTVNVNGSTVEMIIDGQLQVFGAACIFNSLWNQQLVKEQKALHLLQHFKGWMLETPEPFFNPAEATLMDFRVSQANGTTFVYVLPLSSTKALVEYTLFSEKLPEPAVYQAGLAAYLQQHLQLTNYTVTEEEFGVIPMTNAQFPWYQHGMYHIGTAGGQTKASSGYTFQFIQKQSIAIVSQLQNNTLHPGVQPGRALRKFNFYDGVLLRVLAGNYALGSEVFTKLFSKNQPRDIFAFLDNESSLLQDIKIIQSLPAAPFVKAAFRQVFR